MVFGNIECIEVVVFALDLRPFGKRKPHLKEDGVYLADHAAYGVDVSVFHLVDYTQKKPVVKGPISGFNHNDLQLELDAKDEFPVADKEHVVINSKFSARLFVHWLDVAHRTIVDFCDKDAVINR